MTNATATSDHPNARRLRRFAAELAPADRAALEAQIARVDFALMDRLFAQANEPAAPIDKSSIRPMPVLGLPKSDADRKAWRAAEAVGEQALADGRCAVLLVAGGQGSRLGFDGPKGMFPIGPVSDKCLFQIFAEKIRARSRRAGKPIPWYIMTSPGNREATEAFFRERNWFGMPAGDVTFFVQGTMPAADNKTGELLLADKGNLFSSPNGHGGTLLALEKEGVLADMAKRGVDLVYYFQVDNPLVQVLEPAFLGQHLMADAEFSAKVVRKCSPKEKVGLVVLYEGKPTVIEYSDLPDELGTQTNADGNLTYWPGSIAIHVFGRPFLERVAGALPYHVAHKAVPFVNDAGDLVSPKEPNAVKYEMFIFDSMPMARKVNIVETPRDDEFAPVKNASGADSPAVTKAMMSAQAGRWLDAAGVKHPKKSDGSPAVAVEIGPLAGVDLTDFLRRRWRVPEFAGPTLIEEET